MATTPTATASTELDARSTRPPAGNAKPKPSKTPLSSAAMPIPPAHPATEPTSPTTSASASPATASWRRVPPSARSSADSRPRWAARIENVLEMLNAATSSAIAANAVSPVDRKPRKPELMSFRFSVASCAPVMACTPAGSTGRSRAASSVSGTPGLALTRIWVSSASPPGPLGPARCCRAAGSVIPVNVPGPKPSAVPKVVMPTMCTRSGCGVSSVVVMPSARWPVVAAPRLMTTSSSARGACPWTSRYGFSAGSPTQFAAWVGGPLPPIGLPSRPSSWP